MCGNASSIAVEGCGESGRNATAVVDFLACAGLFKVTPKLTPTGESHRTRGRARVARALNELQVKDQKAISTREPSLYLLEPRLVGSLTTVIIPFDDRIIFVGLLNRAEFSCRLSEIAQTFDAISGIQFLAGGRGIGEPWLSGTVRVRGRPTVRQGRLGSFMRFGYPIIGDMRHIPLSLSKRLEQRPWLRRFISSIGTA